MNFEIRNRRLAPGRIAARRVRRRQGYLSAIISSSPLRRVWRHGATALPHKRPPVPIRRVDRAPCTHLAAVVAGRERLGSVPALHVHEGSRGFIAVDVCLGALRAVSGEGPTRPAIPQRVARDGGMGDHRSRAVILPRRRLWNGQFSPSSTGPRQDASRGWPKGPLLIILVVAGFFAAFYLAHATVVMIRADTKASGAVPSGRERECPDSGLRCLRACWGVRECDARCNSRALSLHPIAEPGFGLG